MDGGLINFKQTVRFIFFIRTFRYHILVMFKISEGITISVETFYQPEYSNPLSYEYMFAYRITIENNNNFPVQLLRRHWFIFDSSGSNQEVEGEGVVGTQPVIQPNEHFQYVSGCNLRTEIGRMEGIYLMKNLHTNKLFEAKIPAFELFAPSKSN
jgi:ApaG protein